MPIESDGSGLERTDRNDYLQLAAEGGLLLGVPILLTVVAFAWEVGRRLRQDEGSIWWIRMGAVTGLAIHDGRRNQGETNAPAS